MLPVWLYGVTLFVSAFLLFSMQPMFAKMVLPLLGGTPAVWNTCMVFFQAALLVGYGYAHATTAWLGVRRQARLHLGLLLLPLLFLPIRRLSGWVPPAGVYPVPWLLGLMTVAVGVPFFVVSTSAPLLQRWFAHTDHPLAQDPYFLYAASNLGSLLALLSYPTLVEPHLRLAEQGWAWAAGYGLLVVLTCACALWVWRSERHGRTRVPAAARGASSKPAGRQERLTLPRRLWWVLLAFVPSSLMLGVTTHLSTDIAAIPLMWVVPLALYLLTFVLVFARRPLLAHRSMVWALPLIVLLLAIQMVSRTAKPIWLVILLHLATLFVAAMVCHGELAQDRPAPGHLTEFYLWMSVGGVCGGLFNALAAPLIFETVLEYPFVVMLACLLRPGNDAAAPRPPVGWLDVVIPTALAGFVAGLAWNVSAVARQSEWLRIALLCGPPALVCYVFRYRPIRFGLCIGAFLIVGLLATDEWDHTLHVERSFFGVYRVQHAVRGHGQYHDLLHGTTLHGRQSLEPARRCEPLTYFRTMGEVFEAFTARRHVPRIAVVGLGTGTLVAYAKPGQEWTFYEIDPTVERIARDPRYFTFLSACFPETKVVLGDARLSLVRAPDRGYGMLIVDAFSSDAIPVHLITQEALRLYLAKLADGGLLAFHISNRYLDLKPVLANLAEAERLVCAARADMTISPADREQGITASHWVVMARRAEDFGALRTGRRWRRVRGRQAAAVWTDDFSNLFSAFQWQ